MSLRNQIRNGLKMGIKIFDKLTKKIPGGKIGVLILADFNGNQDQLIEDLADYKVKHIKYSIGKVLIAAYYARRAKVIYVDNINLVIASLDEIDAKVIQYWHATSAVKQFGLATVTDDDEYKLRQQELTNYDYIIANSNYMADKLMRGFGTDEDKLLNIGCIQSKQLFTNDDINPIFDYIVYVPTFRWNRAHDKQALEFIKKFKSDKYKLIYSLHPKVEVELNNPDAINAVGTDIRRYFKHAKLVISDYSSLLVDASLMCNAVVMYAYDINDYKQDPGLYIDRENFWGHYTEDPIELMNYIENSEYERHDINLIKSEYFTFDDEDSIKRIAQVAIDIMKEDIQ